jgi:hypothetical protein
MACRFAVVALMRNEADILEAFVRYHLQFVAGILLIDHRSTDASRAIVAALRREGLPLELRCRQELAYDQERFVNAHAGEAARAFGADWLLSLDLDEALAATGPGAPTEELSRMDPARPVRIPWRTYVPTPGDDLAEHNPFKRIRHRLASETFQFHKVVVPGACLRDKRFRISVGNHDLIDRKTGKPVSAVRATETFLAHYPIRSPEQYASKILVGWLASLTKGDRLRTEAYQWKRSFDLILERGPIRYQDLQAIASDYTAFGDREPDRTLVEDPLAPQRMGFDLTIPGAGASTPVATALRVAEEIAAELGARSSTSGNGTAKRRFRLGRLTLGWG